MKIVGHEEAAAQQIVAQDFGLAFGQPPFAHLDGVEPGPVVNVVAVFQIDGLLDGPDLQARQAPDGFAKNDDRRADNPASRATVPSRQSPSKRPR